MMTLLSDRKKVVIINAKVPRQWEQQVNDTLAAGVKKYKNAVLLDWHGYGGAAPRVLLRRRHPPAARGCRRLRPASPGVGRVRRRRCSGACPGGGAASAIDQSRRDGPPALGRLTPWPGVAVPSWKTLMRSFSRTLITFLLTIVIGGIAVGACLAALIPGTVEIATAHHYTAKQVGEPERARPALGRVLRRRHHRAGRLRRAGRDPITNIDEVPKSVINAVIATEDRSFWTNDGIDLGAVFRAFLANVTSGRIEQGGSTITQQLVKNRLLTSKRDVNRKIKEIEDALRLNKKFSKDKILVEYLNTVYLGSNSYGFKAAAARFFLVCDNGCPFGPRGKNLDELTVGEAALLAGLISNPEGNSPFTHPDRAIHRRADVLRGEVQQGYITQAEADAANREPLPTVPPPAETRPTNFLTAEVQNSLLNDPRMGNTREGAAGQALQGWAEDLHHVRPQPAADGDRRDHERQAAEGCRLDVVAGVDRSQHRRGESDGRGPDFADSQTNIATSPTVARPDPRSR